MESGKYAGGDEGGCRGLPSSTTMITGNPSTAVCDISSHGVSWGEEREGALFQPKFPEVLTNYTPHKAPCT